MREKIAFIAPNEVSKKRIEDVFTEEIAGGEVVVPVIDVLQLEEEGRRLVSEGICAVIARGGTYTSLKACLYQIPVVELEIDTADVIFALQEAMENYQTIYLILNEGIYFDYKIYKNLPDVNIQYYCCHTLEELQEILDGISYRDDMVIVGSGVCTALSRQKRINSITVHVREQTLRKTYLLARSIVRQMKDEISRANLLESILSNVGDGVIIIKSDGTITHFNRKSEELLKIRANQAVDEKIYHLFTDFTLNPSELRQLSQTKDLLMRVRKTVLAFQITPFQLHGDEKRLIIIIHETRKLQELEQNIRIKLSQKGLMADYVFEDILTGSQMMRKLIRKAKKIAAMDGSILIYGESGTGKELFAQSIHNESSRKNGPFVAVNCAALTDSLLESELFGYVPGAFTGAHKDGKAGLFELAHKGTIFLDEINSMTLNLQAKILRVLEQKEVRRVGSDYIIPLDVRFIAAANTNMADYVKRNEFRQDLYFRINTFVINIPSVRERREDILLLFKHYLAGFKQCSPKDIRLENGFIEALESYNWPGNVREIKSTALRYYTFDGDNSTGDILCENSKQQGADLINEELRIDLQELNRTVETLVIQSLIDRNIKKTEIAKMLGITRQTLFNKINK